MDTGATTVLGEMSGKGCVIRPSGFRLCNISCHFSNFHRGMFFWWGFSALETSLSLRLGQRLQLKFLVAVELAAEPSVQFGECAASPASSWTGRE